MEAPVGSVCEYCGFGLVAAGPRECCRAGRDVGALRADAEAGRKLWAYLIEHDDPWSEYQDDFVNMGLLVRVEIPENVSDDERCRNCCGDCDYCYRPTGLLRAAIDEAKGKP